MASKSSMVMFGRLFSLRKSWKFLKPEENLLTEKVVVPNWLIWSVMYWFSPWITLTTAITDATPMITPNKVRNERNLCAASAWNASLMVSRLTMGFLPFQPISGRSIILPFVWSEVTLPQFTFQCGKEFIY